MSTYIYKVLSVNKNKGFTQLFSFKLLHLLYLLLLLNGGVYLNAQNCSGTAETVQAGLLGINPGVVTNTLLNLDQNATSIDEVCVLIEHDFYEDLDIILVAPDGTEYTLVSAGSVCSLTGPCNVGVGAPGCSPDFGDVAGGTEVCFVPTGGIPASDYCGGSGGAIGPINSVMDFTVHTPVQGAWTLMVQDNEGLFGASGSLDSWSINFTGGDDCAFDCTSTVAAATVAAGMSPLCCGDVISAMSASTPQTKFGINWVLTSGTTGAVSAADVSAALDTLGEDALTSETFTNDCATYAAGDYSLTPYLATNALCDYTYYASSGNLLLTVGGGATLTLADLPPNADVSFYAAISAPGLSALPVFIANSPNTIGIALPVISTGGYQLVETFTGDPNGTYDFSALAGVGVGDIKIDIIVQLDNIESGFIHPDCSLFGAPLTFTIAGDPMIGIAGIAEMDQFCADDMMAYNLTGSPIPVAPATGIFSGTGVVDGGGTGAATFTPSTAGVGSHSITYSYVDDLGCPTDSTITVTINAVPVASITTILDPAYCADDMVVSLAATPVPVAGEMGVFSGSGVTDTGSGTGTFDPSMATTGAPVTISYTFTDAAGCVGTADVMTTVYDVLDTPAFDPLSYACDFSTGTFFIDINAPTMGGSGGMLDVAAVGGSSSAAMVALSGMITLSNIPPGGSWSVTFTDITSGCDVIVMNVAPPMSECFVCNVAAGGITIDDNVLCCGEDFTITPDGAAMIQAGFDVCYAIAGPAGVASAMDVQNADSILNTTSFTNDCAALAGGQYSVTPYICTDGTSPIIFTQVDTVASALITLGGTYSVLVDVGCTMADVDVQMDVTGLDVLGDIFTYTYSSPTGNVLAGLSVSSDGTFYIDSDTGVNPNGSYDLTTAAITNLGDDVVVTTTITVTGVGCVHPDCNDFGTPVVFDVAADPMIGISGIADMDQFCEEDMMNYTVTGVPTPVAPATGVFSSTSAGGGLVDGGNGTATFNPNIAGVGTYDIIYTYTDDLGCITDSTIMVTVNATPVVTLMGLADGDVFCTDDPVVNLTGMPAPPATGTFMATNGGITDNGNGTATFDPSAATAGSNTITYDYIDANGCASSASVMITVFDALDAPTFDAAMYVCDMATGTFSIIVNAPTMGGAGGMLTVTSPINVNTFTPGMIALGGTVTVSGIAQGSPLDLTFTDPTSGCDVSINDLTPASGCMVCTADIGTPSTVSDDQLCCGESFTITTTGESTDPGYDVFWSISTNASGDTSAAMIGMADTILQGNPTNFTHDCSSLAGGQYYITPYVGTSGAGTGTDTIVVSQTFLVASGGIVILQLNELPIDIACLGATAEYTVEFSGFENVLETIVYDIAHPDGNGGLTGPTGLSVNSDGVAYTSGPITPDVNGTYDILIVGGTDFVGEDIFATLTVELYDVPTGCINPVCNDIADAPADDFYLLNPLTYSVVENCNGGEVTIFVDGGAPEFIASSTYNATNTGSGTLVQSGVAGETITISGIMPGDTYSFDIDGGCGLESFNGTFDCSDLCCAASPGVQIPTGIPLTFVGSASNTLINYDSDGLLGTNGNLNEVCVLIEHTFIGDLQVELTSPSGTTITLLDFDDVGGATCINTNDIGDVANGNLVCFSDVAITPLSPTICGGFTGSYIPNTPLSTFDGEMTEGAWTITINDEGGIALSDGQLVQWGMNFSDVCCEFICNSTVDAAAFATGEADAELCCGDTFQASVTAMTQADYGVYWVLTNDIVATPGVLADSIEAMGFFGENNLSSDVFTNDCATYDAGTYCLTPYLGTTTYTTQVFIDSSGTFNIGLLGNASVTLAGVPFDGTTTVDVDVAVTGGPAGGLLGIYDSPNVIGLGVAVTGGRDDVEDTAPGTDPNGTYTFIIPAGVSITPMNIELIVTVNDIPPGYLDPDCPVIGTDGICFEVYDSLAAPTFSPSAFVCDPLTGTLSLDVVAPSAGGSIGSTNFGGMLMVSTTSSAILSTTSVAPGGIVNISGIPANSTFDIIFTDPQSNNAPGCDVSLMITAPDCEVCTADVGTPGTVSNDQLCCGENFTISTTSESTDPGYDIYWAISSGTGGATTPVAIGMADTILQGNPTTFTHDCASLPGGQYSITPYVGTNGAGMGTDTIVVSETFLVASGGIVLLNTFELPVDVACLGATAEYTIEFNGFELGENIIYDALHPDGNGGNTFVVGANVSADGVSYTSGLITPDVNGVYDLQIISGIDLFGEDLFATLTVKLYDMPNGCIDPNCNDIATMPADSFYLLNPLSFIEAENCVTGEVTVTVTGALPEFVTNASYSANNTGNGTLTQSGVNNEIITINGLMSGDTYMFTVDGGCGPETFMGTLDCADNNDCPSNATDITSQILGVDNCCPVSCTEYLYNPLSDGNAPTNDYVSNDPIACDAGPIYNDVWFSFTVNATTPPTWLDVFSADANSPVLFGVALYELPAGATLAGNCNDILNPITGLNYIDCSAGGGIFEDGPVPIFTTGGPRDVSECTTPHPRIDISNLPFGTYYIRIWDFGSTTPGLGNFNLCAQSAVVDSRGTDGCPAESDNSVTFSCDDEFGPPYTNVNYTQTLTCLSNAGSFGNSCLLNSGDLGGNEPPVPVGVYQTSAELDPECDGTFNTGILYTNTVVNNTVFYGFQIDALSDNANPLGCYAVVNFRFENVVVQGEDGDVAQFMLFGDPLVGPIVTGATPGSCDMVDDALAGFNTGSTGCVEFQSNIAAGASGLGGFPPGTLPNGYYYWAVEGLNGALVCFDLTIEVVYQGDCETVRNCGEPPVIEECVSLELDNVVCDALNTNYCADLIIGNEEGPGATYDVTYTVAGVSGSILPIYSGVGAGTYNVCPVLPDLPLAAGVPVSITVTNTDLLSTCTATIDTTINCPILNTCPDFGAVPFNINCTSDTTYCADIAVNYPAAAIIGNGDGYYYIAYVEGVPIDTITIDFDPLSGDLGDTTTLCGIPIFDQTTINGQLELYDADSMLVCTGLPVPYPEPTCGTPLPCPEFTALPFNLMCTSDSTYCADIAVAYPVSAIVGNGDGYYYIAYVEGLPIDTISIDFDPLTGDVGDTTTLCTIPIYGQGTITGQLELYSDDSLLVCRGAEFIYPEPNCTDFPSCPEFTALPFDFNCEMGDSTYCAEIAVLYPITEIIGDGMGYYYVAVIEGVPVDTIPIDIDILAGDVGDTTLLCGIPIYGQALITGQLFLYDADSNAVCTGLSFEYPEPPCPIFDCATFIALPFDITCEDGDTTYCADIAVTYPVDVLSLDPDDYFYVVFVEGMPVDTFLLDFDLLAGDLGDTATVCGIPIYDQLTVTGQLILYDVNDNSQVCVGPSFEYPEAICPGLGGNCPEFTALPFDFNCEAGDSTYCTEIAILYPTDAILGGGDGYYYVAVIENMPVDTIPIDFDPLTGDLGDTTLLCNIPIYGDGLAQLLVTGQLFLYDADSNLVCQGLPFEYPEPPCPIFDCATFIGLPFNYTCEFGDESYCVDIAVTYPVDVLSLDPDDYFYVVFVEGLPIDTLLLDFDLLTGDLEDTTTLCNIPIYNQPLITGQLILYDINDSSQVCVGPPFEYPEPPCPIDPSCAVFGALPFNYICGEPDSDCYDVQIAVNYPINAIVGDGDGYYYVVYVENMAVDTFDIDFDPLVGDVGDTSLVTCVPFYDQLIVTGQTVLFDENGNTVCIGFPFEYPEPPCPLDPSCAAFGALPFNVECDTINPATYNVDIAVNYPVDAIIGNGDGYYYIVYIQGMPVDTIDIDFDPLAGDIGDTTTLTGIPIDPNTLIVTGFLELYDENGNLVCVGAELLYPQPTCDRCLEFTAIPFNITCDPPDEPFYDVDIAVLYPTDAILAGEDGYYYIVYIEGMPVDTIDIDFDPLTGDLGDTTTLEDIPIILGGLTITGVLELYDADSMLVCICAPFEYPQPTCGSCPEFTALPFGYTCDANDSTYSVDIAVLYPIDAILGDGEDYYYIAYIEGVAIDTIPIDIDILAGDLGDTTTLSGIVLSGDVLVTGQLVLYDADGNIVCIGLPFEYPEPPCPLDPTCLVFGALPIEYTCDANDSTYSVTIAVNYPVDAILGDGDGYYYIVYIEGMPVDTIPIDFDPLVGDLGDTTVLTGIPLTGQNLITGQLILFDENGETVCISQPLEYPEPPCPLDPTCLVFGALPIEYTCDANDSTYSVTIAVNYPVDAIIGDGDDYYYIVYIEGMPVDTVDIDFDLLAGDIGDTTVLTGIPLTGQNLITGQLILFDGDGNTVCISQPLEYPEPPCPLDPTCLTFAAVPFNIECTSDSTYNVDLGILYPVDAIIDNGTGYYYVVYIEGVAVDTMFIDFDPLAGDLGDTTTLSLDIINQNLITGQIILFDENGSTVCIGPPLEYPQPICGGIANCFMTLSPNGPISVTCDSDNTYSLTFEVAYGNTSMNGFTYSIGGATAVPVSYTGNPQTVTVNGLPADGMMGVTLVVADQDNPTCMDSATFNTPSADDCATPVCMLMASASASVCQSDGTYSLTLDVTYANSGSNGFTYDIGNGLATGTVNYDGTGNQTITVNNLPGSGGTFNVSVADVDDPACMEMITYDAPNCPCDLNASIIPGLCLGDGTYNATLIVDYSFPEGTGFTYSINGGAPVSVSYDGTGSQSISLTSLAGDGMSVSIINSDDTNATCGDIVSYDAPDCGNVGDDCQIVIASLVAGECNADGSYDLTMIVNYNANVGSNGFNYSVDGGANTNTTYDGTGTQTVIITGLMGMGQTINIDVFDADDPTCSDNAPGFLAPDCSTVANCSLVVSATAGTCQIDGTYNVDVTVTYSSVESNGFTYNIGNGLATGTVMYDGTGMQTFTVSGLSGNTGIVAVNVADLDILTCFANNVFASASCICNINANATIGECLTDGTFIIDLVVNYDQTSSAGFTYSVNGGTNFAVAYDGTGTQTVSISGNVGDGSNYNIIVTDQDNANCSDFVLFNAPDCGGQECTLDVSVITGQCLADGTFDYTLIVTYDPASSNSGFTYSVDNDGPVTVAYDGTGLQTITISGTAGDVTDYTVVVIDQDDLNCTASTTFTAPDCSVIPDECSLEIDAFTTQCNDDGTYTAALVISRNDQVGSSGFNYSVNGNAPINVSYDMTLSQQVIITNLPGDGSPAIVAVEDAEMADCNDTFTYTAPDCEEVQVCMLSVSTSTNACQVDGSYDLTVTVNYSNGGPSGFIYDIGNGTYTGLISYDGTGTQSFTISGIPGDGLNGSVVITDALFVNSCQATANFQAPSCPCSIDASVVVGQCDTDGTVDVMVTITYEQTSSVGFTYSTGSIGPITVAYDGSGMQTIAITDLVGDGSTNTLMVSDLDNINCTNSTEFILPTCITGNDCSLNIQGTSTSCNSDGTYDLTVTIAYSNASAGFTYNVGGSGAVTESYDGSGMQTFTVSGLSGDGSDVSIMVMDSEISDCSDSLTFTSPTCITGNDCSLNIQGTSASCNSDGTYDLTVTIAYSDASAGFTYNVGGLGTVTESYDGSGMQTFTVSGLSGDGLDVSIMVMDSEISDCSDGLTFTSPTCIIGNDCSLNIQGTSTSCNSDGTFDVILTIGGSGTVGNAGFNYSIDGGTAVNIPYNGMDTQDVIITGLFGTGGNVLVSIEDTEIANCGEVLVFTSPNCNTDLACELDILGTSTACNENGTYDLTFLFAVSGDIGNAGFNYSIDGGLNVNVPYNGIAIQEVNVSDLPGLGNNVSLSINDALASDCSDVIGFTAPDCTQASTCGLTVTAIPSPCNANGNYSLSLTVDYQDVGNTGFTYDVGNGFFTGLIGYDGSGSQTIVINDIPGDGSINAVTVADALFNECTDITAYQAPNCVCDIDLDVVVGPCLMDNSFNITLVVEYNQTNAGGFNYSINGGTMIPVNYDGTGLQAVTVTGLEGDGSSYSIMITDMGNAGCSDVFTFTSQDCQNVVVNECDLQLSSVPTECQADGNYLLAMTISTNGLTGDNGFNYVINGGAHIFVAYDGILQQTEIIQLPGTGGSITIEVVDVDMPDCGDVITYNAPNCNTFVQNCDLDISAIPTNCDGNGNYSLSLLVNYTNPGVSGFSYDIGNGAYTGTVAYDGSGLQTIIIDDIMSDSQLQNVVVTDLFFGNDCLTSTAYQEPSCECSLDLDVIVGQCLSDGTFDITLLVEYDPINAGSFTYSINGTTTTAVAYDGSGLQAIVIGDNIGDGSSYAITVMDQNDASCTDNFIFSSNVCEIGAGGDCNIQIDAITTECNDDGTYTAVLIVSRNDEVGNSGFNYSINNGASINIAYDMTLSQQVIIADLPGTGQPTFIKIEDAEIANCSYTITITAPECDFVEQCDLEMFAIPSECQGNGTYNLSLVINYVNAGPAGFAYDIGNGMFVGTAAYDGTGSQVVVIENLLGNGELVDIMANDIFFNNSCLATNTYQVPSCECTLDVDAIPGQCLSDNTFDMTLIVEYSETASSGFVYSIDGEEPVMVDYDGTGLQFITITQNMGDGNTYDVMVADQDNEACSDNTSFTAPSCMGGGADECILVANATTSMCNTDGTFDLVLTVSRNDNVGNNGFELFIDGVSYGITNYTTNISQQVIVNGIIGDGEMIQVSVNDVDDSTCSDVLSVNTPDCNVLADCNLDLTITPGVCGTDGTYTIVIIVSYENVGSTGFEYFVSGTDKTGQIPYNGTGIQSVVIEGLTGNGTILVNDLDLSNCSDSEVYDGEDCFESDGNNTQCDEFQATAEVICNDDDNSYRVIISAFSSDPDDEFLITSLNGFNGVFTGLPYTDGPFDTPNGYSYTISLVSDPSCSQTFAVDNIDCITTPIELLSFTGTVQKTGNQLNWATATERDNDYFTLERSFDGINFKEIAQIDGAGNSNHAIRYSYLDKEARTGNSYYRLLQTDFDGNTEVTSKVIVLFKTDISNINVYPVPAESEVVVSFIATEASQYDLEIYNVVGKVIEIISIETIDGLNNFRLDISSYANGLYLVKMQSENQVQEFTIIKTP